MAVILKNLIKRSMLTIPTFLYVADICRIVKRSGLDNGSNFKKFDKAVTADSSHFFICSGYMQDSETVGNER